MRRQSSCSSSPFSSTYLSRTRIPFLLLRDPPTSPAEQLAQSVFGRSWSCGGQVSLTIVTLLEFSELKANQLLDFVRQVSERGGSSTGDTVLFDFAEDNVAVGWTEEDDVVYANGSQALLAMVLDVRFP